MLLDTSKYPKKQLKECAVVSSKAMFLLYFTLTITWGLILDIKMPTLCMCSTIFHHLVFSFLTPSTIVKRIMLCGVNFVKFIREITPITHLRQSVNNKTFFFKIIITIKGRGRGSKLKLLP